MSLVNRMLRSLALVGVLAALIPVAAQAEEGLHLDQAPLHFDNRALQNGAKFFVNYCLNCHGASYMRYNRLTQIGLTEQQIKDNLMFAADKVGEQMRVALRREDAKQWFGVVPPDLTVIARSRASESGTGADWLYTYLRQFYRDESRPTGWNNAVFSNVGMPHVLWELQGVQEARFVEKDDGHGSKVKHLESLEIVQPGTFTKEEYDEAVSDLVSFLVWMGEPAQESRRSIGWVVLAVLGVLAVLSYLLKKAYWKDVR
jgi:ubiquinol-cytochrome c reductase cytochrome c1 subunit